MAASGKDIFDVFPTPMAKQIIKTRLATAEKGHKILEKKGEELEMRFRKIGKEIVEMKSQMGEIFKETGIVLAEARFTTGDFNQLVLNGVEKARLKVKSMSENVAGVSLTRFELITEGSDSFALTGLAKGGERLLSLKQTYAKAVETLVELATLQTTFKMLDEAIKSINRRVNSLEHMYIPKCERTLQYITEEMDDRDRQEFFRLKKIKDLKNRLAEEKKNIREKMSKKRKEDASEKEKEETSKEKLENTSKENKEETVKEKKEEKSKQRIEEASKKKMNETSKEREEETSKEREEETSKEKLENTSKENKEELLKKKKEEKSKERMEETSKKKKKETSKEGEEETSKEKKEKSDT